ncbi:MAG: ABC transporter substrate-binding protein [Chloroflexi bacterium]|nr:ABC transporter substrate-binding protein [Chloroflexota bacterium]
MHLPFFAAVADGLFAEHGLDVHLLESAPGSQRVKHLAQGEGDFLLTATLYHLQALAEEGPLPVRACAVLHRRSSVSGLVRSDSPLQAPADLSGRRLGAPEGTQMGWLAAELQASLTAAGHGPAQIVDMSYKDAYPALARGEIDMIANLAELLPIDQGRAVVPLRAVPAGPDVYTSSVLAADSVADEVVGRMRAAVVASFERQRTDPRRGVTELRAMYPDVDADVAVETWLGLEPYVFGPPGVGTMDAVGWERTVAWAIRTHGLPGRVADEHVERRTSPAPVS